VSVQAAYPPIRDAYLSLILSSTFLPFLCFSVWTEGVARSRVALDPYFLSPDCSMLLSLVLSLVLATRVRVVSSIARVQIPLILSQWLFRVWLNASLLEIVTAKLENIRDITIFSWNTYFCSHIAECANSAEFANIAEIFRLKTFGDIEPHPVLIKIWKLHYVKNF
jgi:hypothetical protein